MSKPIVDELKQPLAVGDYVRSVETGWRGQIESVYNEEDGYLAMLVCKGVNFWTGEIDHDDVQHYAAMDVRKTTRHRKVDDPINMLNVL